MQKKQQQLYLVYTNVLELKPLRDNNNKTKNNGVFLEQSV